MSNSSSDAKLSLCLLSSQFQPISFCREKLGTPEKEKNRERVMLLYWDGEKSEIVFSMNVLFLMHCQCIKCNLLLKFLCQNFYSLFRLQLKCPLLQDNRNIFFCSKLPISTWTFLIALFFYLELITVTSL